MYSGQLRDSTRLPSMCRSSVGLNSKVNRHSNKFPELAKRYLDVIKIGETGYAWLVSRDGTLLYSPIPGFTGKSAFETSKDFPSLIVMENEMLKAMTAPPYTPLTESGTGMSSKPGNTRCTCRFISGYVLVHCRGLGRTGCAFRPDLVPKQAGPGHQCPVHLWHGVFNPGGEGLVDRQRGGKTQTDRRKLRISVERFRQVAETPGIHLGGGREGSLHVREPSVEKPGVHRGRVGGEEAFLRSV